MDDDLELSFLTDQSVYISQAIGQVWSAALFGGILAVFVLYFFLRDVRSTVIIGVSIPVSVIATFLPMYKTGVSLNIMSLGGLALGVGMLVDNSIVVLENINRHLAMRRKKTAGRLETSVELPAGRIEFRIYVSADGLETQTVNLTAELIGGETHVLRLVIAENGSASAHMT